MDLIMKDGMEFLRFKDGKVNILFSTAKNNVSYKLSDAKSLENFERLKDIFNVDHVNYTNQIHSDIIINLDDEFSKGKEADGLITSKKNEIIGVFTADCVPVILYDSDKQVICAVHSGWKGTISSISKKVANIMKERYKCEKIKAIIGPCVLECCYEVSEELAQKFEDKYGASVREGRMLKLVESIKQQLASVINECNIQELNICTNCTTDYEMHSYRRANENSGRLFSFVYVEN